MSSTCPQQPRRMTSLVGLGQAHHHSHFLRLSLGLCLGLFSRLRPSPSNRKSAAPWASSRGGRRSRPSCPPHTPCTDGGRVHGCFPCHNRPSTRRAETCTLGTRAVGSRSSLALCPLVPPGSIWTDPAHCSSRCAPQTRRNGPPLDPSWTSGLGHFHYHPPQSWPCPPGSPDDGGFSRWPRCP